MLKQQRVTLRLNALILQKLEAESIYVFIVDITRDQQPMTGVAFALVVVWHRFLVLL